MQKFAGIGVPDCQVRRIIAENKAAMPTEADAINEMGRVFTADLQRSSLDIPDRRGLSAVTPDDSFAVRTISPLGNVAEGETILQCHSVPNLYCVIEASRGDPRCIKIKARARHSTRVPDESSDLIACFAVVYSRLHRRARRQEPAAVSARAIRHFGFHLDRGQLDPRFRIPILPRSIRTDNCHTPGRRIFRPQPLCSRTRRQRLDCAPIFYSPQFHDCLI